jgi:hypothetical protein
MKLKSLLFIWIMEEKRSGFCCDGADPVWLNPLYN